ncbi:MAG: ABC transporter permease [Bacilli bacterium]|jgi:osmoprotectant transport system permease protein|uniref:ABC transporter permease n=1 Tax=Ureibacillus suwonensis TaxID=313007 RepID=A0ABW0RGY9_9BACL|nr:glycine/betaine ABC transporter [Bacilli bacterium]
METVQKAWNYIQQNPEKFMEAFQEHLILSIIALLIAMIIGITIGIICAKNEKISSIIMGIFNSLRVIPSLAILIIVLPIMGTGFYPALVALTVLACPPIIINTFTGFREIDRSVIEAASGMGMNEKQILRKIEFPLALPIIIAGCRTAAVEVVASATLAAFIGGGGLGTFIINGLGMYNIPLLLVGAIPVALLAILSEVSFATTEKFFTRYLRD